MCSVQQGLKSVIIADWVPVPMNAMAADRREGLRLHRPSRHRCRLEAALGSGISALAVDADTTSLATSSGSNLPFGKHAIARRKEVRETWLAGRQGVLGEQSLDLNRASPAPRSLFPHHLHELAPVSTGHPA